jgi:hypothetical protein
MTTTVAAVAAVAIVAVAVVVVIWPLKISGFEMRPRRHP